MGNTCASIHGVRNKCINSTNRIEEGTVIPSFLYFIGKNYELNKESCIVSIESEGIHDTFRISK